MAESSRKIRSVTNMIVEFAEETNMLALNAAIEAAKAGQSGKGFAVVADEVRRLAEGSAKSSDEISHLIKNIERDSKLAVETIDDGTKEILEGKVIIEESLKALDTIAEKIQKVTNNIQEVSTSTEKQVSEIEKISSSSSNIAAVAEENAASTEQASAATEEQTAAIQELSTKIQNINSTLKNMKNSSKNIFENRLPVRSKRNGKGGKDND